MTQFYNDISTSFPFIERAVLMEDIKLPVLNKKKNLTRKFFYSIQRIFSYEPTTYVDNFVESERNNEFKLAYNEIKNVSAKFYVPVLMAGIKSSDKMKEINIKNRAPKTTGFIGNLDSQPYSSSNCITLTIPKYMIFQFLDQKNEIEGVKDPFIPKGTEFLIASVGGSMDLDQIRIIGLYTLTYDKKSFPNLKDTYYGGNPTS